MVAMLSVVSVEARVTLSSIWGDGMVIQREQQVLFWGESTAANGRSVVIAPSWSKTKYKAVVADGRWSVKIPTAGAGGPYTVSFDDGEETTLSDVLLGDVWLCMGQSNMEMPMAGWANQPVLEAQSAILGAGEKENIRLYQMEITPSQTPQSDVEGSWARCSPQSVADFSAVGYLFGREINAKLDVPIGLLSINKGASIVETWMAQEWLEQFKEYDYSVLAARKIPFRYQWEVCMLYNGMLAPIEGLAVKGAIWYQGESNIYNIEEYESLFPLFVKRLRDHFDGGEFPFYYVQIAPYNVLAEFDNGVAMRELQTKLQDLTPRTGMVTLTDVGEERIIHPRHKVEVAQRLALWAFSDTYGIEGIECRAPEYESMKIAPIAEGSQQQGVALKFNSPAMMHFRDGQESTLFEVAGEDRVFHPARVKFISDKEGYAMVAWSEEVESPVAARYAFSNYVVGDLFSNFGLPISSFRTDDWQLRIKPQR